MPGWRGVPFLGNDPFAAQVWGGKTPSLHRPSVRAICIKPLQPENNGLLEKIKLKEQGAKATLLFFRYGQYGKFRH
jgi:hypothetical protein